MKVWVQWGWLTLLIPAAFGLARLEFDVEVLNLLPPQSAPVQALRLYQTHFANAGQLILTIQTARPETSAQIAQAIAHQLRVQPGLVSHAYWQPPWLEHPDDTAELAAFRWLNQPPDHVRALVQRLSPQNLPAALAQTQQELATSLSPFDLAQLSYDPLKLLRLPQDEAAAAWLNKADELFQSPDGAFHLIYVQPASSLNNYRQCLRWLGNIQNLIQTWRRQHPNLPSDLTIRFTGRPAFVAEIAAGMERDIHRAVLGTLTVILLLFWAAHRRLRPLLALLALLLLILTASLGLGGLVFRTLNVVSAGFAAILLGLSADYALVLYQEFISLPRNANPCQITQITRKILAPSIAWAALTTAAAFLTLNLSGLPGLAQLGSLVGIGITLAAVAFWSWFLPLAGDIKNPHTQLAPTNPRSRSLTTVPHKHALGWTTTILLLITTALVLSSGSPKLDATPDALRPRHSPAYAALAEIKQRLQQPSDPLWLIIPGADPDAVARRIQTARAELTRAASNHRISTFLLQPDLWPTPALQHTNQALLRPLLDQRARVRSRVLAQGFTPNALALTEKIFDAWSLASTRPVFIPTNHLAQFLFDQTLARDPAGPWFALALIQPPRLLHPNASPNRNEQTHTLLQWSQALAEQNLWLGGWDVLGHAVFTVAQNDLPLVLWPLAGLLLVCLGLAFRRAREVLLSLAALALSGLLLLTIMITCGWSWNLMNLMALPLFLGTGIDYSIHMQLALKRHPDSPQTASHTVGRALFLCAATTAAGFGSLAGSGNIGLASLGKICATGVLCSFVVSVGLLPTWWNTWQTTSPRPPSPLA